jgi:hypothetical protein
MFGMMCLHLAINSLGTMVPDICEKAGIHILDEAELVLLVLLISVTIVIKLSICESLISRKSVILSSKSGISRFKSFSLFSNMSITGHKSESSLKTYTGYTSDRVLRDMSNTISSNLRETSTTENKENDLNREIPDFDDNITDFLLMSDRIYGQVETHHTKHYFLV